jgi:hypothetical protein
MPGFFWISFLLSLLMFPLTLQHRLFIFFKITFPLTERFEELGQFPSPEDDKDNQ